MEQWNLKLVAAIVMLVVLVYMAFRERARQSSERAASARADGDQFFKRCPPPS